MTSKPAAKRRSDFHKIMATVRYRLWDDGLGEKTHKQCVGVQLSDIWSFSLLCRCNQERIAFLLEERERNCKIAVPKNVACRSCASSSYLI